MSQPETDSLAARVRALENDKVELEIRIAYQDQLLKDLDTVVREFSGRVESLETQLAQAREALESMREAGPANDPPPHY